ncbi:MAG: hypothetical protein ABSA57_19400 [Candidatus Acidiferrales bacterium]
MNNMTLGFALIFLAGCSQQQTSNANSTAALEAEITQLKAAMDDLKPGLGEIMGVIQQHHAKLYYAGTKSNWPLADYELGEIQEGLQDAVQFNPTFKGAPVASLVPALTKGSLQKVHDAIDKKNKKAFLEAYNSLSTSCSNCHKAANHPFVQIQVPSDAQFSDQKFTP